MSPLPISLVSAARSGEVRGSYLAVFVELHEWLDAEEFKTAPAWKLAELLNMDRSNVYAALDVLVRRGFLSEGERCGNARTFRISVPQQRVA